MSDPDTPQCLAPGRGAGGRVELCDPVLWTWLGARHRDTAGRDRLDRSGGTGERLQCQLEIFVGVGRHQ